VLALATQVATIKCFGYLLISYIENKIRITYGFFILFFPVVGGVVELIIASCIVFVNGGHFNFDRV
jgi:hypothetical protein